MNIPNATHDEANALHRRIFDKNNRKVLILCVVEESAELNVAMMHLGKGRGSPESVLEEWIDTIIAGQALVDELKFTKAQIEEMYHKKVSKYYAKMMKFDTMKKSGEPISEGPIS